MSHKYHAFCVKCQSDRMVNHVYKVRLANGALAIKGQCSHCNTPAYRIITGRERRSWSPMRSFLMGIIVSSVATLGFIAIGHYGVGKTLNNALNSISSLSSK